MNASRRKTLRSLIYALTAISLLAALLFPDVDLPLRRANLSILVDDSTSMDNRMPDYWASLGRALVTIPDNIDVSLIRFASHAVTEIPATKKTDAWLADLFAQPHIPRFAAIDRSSTDIEEALQLAINRRGQRSQSSQPGDAILLLSDAGETHGDASAVLQRYAQRLPVFSLIDPSQIAVKPVWVNRYNAPQLAKPGESFFLTAELHSSLNTRVKLGLYSDNDLMAQQYETLTANTPRVVTMRLHLDTPGDHTLALTVSGEMDGDEMIDMASREITIVGPAAVILVSEQGLPGFAQALRETGRRVRTVRPGQFTRSIPDLQHGSVIVLDDISYDTFSDSTWSELVDAVRSRGCGLVVLGGEDAFAAGGYRHSQLESLLPVVSEPDEDQDTAAIMFVVDKSGSMAQADAGNARFAIARRALTRTVAQLARNDETGLIVFDDATEMALPLANRDNDTIAFANALPNRVGGGTQLAPAIALAIEQLTTSEKQRRILLLLTDGYTDDHALSESKEQLAAAGITVIAFAMGEQANVAALFELAAANNGSVHRVSELSGLPALVRKTIEQERDLVHRSVSAVIASPSLDMDINNWPDVSGFALTRARDAADVLLFSEHGDPLLAVWSQGAGQVAALPAGLGPWTSDWPQWPGWREFSDNVIRHADTAAASDILRIDLHTGPNVIRVSAQALDQDFEWSQADSLTAAVTDPLQRQTTHRIPATAAGRFEAELPANLDGVYTVTMHHLGTQARRRISRQSHGEISAARGALQSWIDNGFVRLWDPGIAARLLRKKPVTVNLRTPLLVLALLLYLTIIIEERGRSLLSRFYHPFFGQS